MPTPTNQQLADACATAISDLITGKISQWSAFGQSYTYHDLGTLEELRSRYQSLADQETRGSVTIADMRDTNR